eukprot:gene3945-4910_t
MTSFSNSTFSVQFEAEFTAQMAASAGIATSAVNIVSIVSGSVQVSSEAMFHSMDSASVFSNLLKAAPSAIFNSSTFLGYGTPTTTSLSSAYGSLPPPPPPPPTPPPPPPQFDIDLSPSSVGVTGCDPSPCFAASGAVEGIQYLFELTVTKGERTDTAVTTINVTKGHSPIPAISAVAGKVNPSQKLTLRSTVRGVDNETQAQLQWDVIAAEATPPLDLLSPAVLASASAHGAELVLHPNSLAPGGTYEVILTATLEGGKHGSASIQLVVNVEPVGGTLHVAPLEGKALETEFHLSTASWVDEDLPLEYLFSYIVPGASGTNHSASEAAGEEVVLAAYGPLSNVQLVLPEAGAAEADSVVEIRVYARDRYKAVGGPWAVNVTVTSPLFESEVEVVSYSKAVVETAAAALQNGAVDVALNSVAGSTSLLSVEATAERRRRRRVRLRQLRQERPEEETSAVEAEGEGTDAAVLHERRLQREEMMMLVRDANVMVVASDKVQERISMLVRGVVACPAEELSAGTQDIALEVLETVVQSALGDPSVTGASKLSTATAAQVLASLSSLIAESASTAAVAERAQDVLHSSADALLQTLVSGELPVQVTSAGMQLTTQRDALSGVGSTAERLFDHALAAEEGSGSIPGVDGTGEGTGTVTVTLTSDNSEVAVQNLTEPISLNLTLEQYHEDGGVLPARTPSDPPLLCSFWDTVGGSYSTAGCATLPNPMPRNARLYWREEVWGSLLGGGSSGSSLTDPSLSLATSWGIAHGSLLDGCSEEYVAAPGGDEGTLAEGTMLRKYSGAECTAMDRRNNETCWWNWIAAGFMGPGCELSPVLQCRCTHLSDFRSIAAIGSFEDSEPEVEFLTLEDLTSFDPEEDFAKNTYLLTIVGSLAGGTLILVIVSNLDDRKQSRIHYENFFSQHGTGRCWRKEETNGLQTWGLFEEEVNSRVHIKWPEKKTKPKYMFLVYGISDYTNEHSHS